MSSITFNDPPISGERSEHPGEFAAEAREQRMQELGAQLAQAQAKAAVRKRFGAPSPIAVALASGRVPSVRVPSVTDTRTSPRPRSARSAASGRPAGRRARTRRASSSGSSRSTDDDPSPPAAGRRFEAHPLGFSRPLNGHRRWPGSRIYREVYLDGSRRTPKTRPLATVHAITMQLCECGCGRTFPASRTKPRRFASDACRKRASRVAA